MVGHDDTVTRHRKQRTALRRGFTVFLALTLAVAGTLVAAAELRIVGDAIEQRTLAAFYEAPDGALDGAAGSLVRSEPLLGVPVGARAWRIMYRTTDLHGEPVLATGVVVTPLDPAPAGGRTVLAWGHPTTGTAPECAPSRSLDPFIGIEGMRIMLDRGYTVVATDYVGMGTDGPDSYLVGDTAAHAVLDAVRAARHLPSAHASSSVVMWGHSQGGQAVVFAAERAPEYAPELTVTGVAVAAPAADLTTLLGDHLDDVSGVTIGSYAFSAYAQVYAERGADLDTVLTPAAQALLPEMNRLCLLTHISELHEIAAPVIGTFAVANPRDVEPWATLLTENSAGGATFDAPLFVAQGLSDRLVLPAATEAFVAAEQALGMDVSFHTLKAADHGTIAYLALPALVDWLDAHAL